MKKQLLNLCLMGAAVMFSGTIFAQADSHPSDTLAAPPAKYDLPVRAIEIPQADASIDVNGSNDGEGYSDLQDVHVFNHTGLTGGDADYDANFNICWDMDYFYWYVEISDDVAHEAASGDNTWEFDNIELFIDLDTGWSVSQYTGYGEEPEPGYENVCQMRINRGVLGVSDLGRVDAGEWLYAEGTNGASGWSVELGMPWSAVLAEGDLPEYMFCNKAIGFDFSGADSDGTNPGPEGARDVQTCWDTEKAVSPDNAWYHRSTFGLVTTEGGCPPYIPRSVNEITKSSIHIYPNPAGNKINFEIAGLSTIEIYSITGKQVMVVEHTDGKGIDISSLQSGIYIAKINGKSVKLVVQ